MLPITALLVYLGVSLAYERWGPWTVADQIALTVGITAGFAVGMLAVY